MMNMKKKILGEWHTSSIEKKIPKLFGEGFMYECRLHCLHRRKFKTRLKICNDEDEESNNIRAIRRHSSEIIILSRQELRKGIHTLCCRMWIKHEINILLQKLVWWPITDPTMPRKVNDQIR